MRVTQGLFIDRALLDLQNQLRNVFDAQEQLATGLRVNRPSDDPLDARRAIDLRFEIAQSQQFISNISETRPHITSSANALGNAVNILQRVRELTIQGANGSNSQAQLDQIAEEIDQLLEEIVVVSNTETNGRFLFSGTRTLTASFIETRVAGQITSVAYQGNTAGFEIAISDSARVQVNVDGTDTFQGASDIFATLIGIRDDLLAGNQANLSTTRLDELDAGIQQLLLAQAQLGAAENRMDRVSANEEDTVIANQLLLSDKIDADFAETTLRLNNSINGLQAALDATGRVLQPSLLDFIR